MKSRIRSLKVESRVLINWRCFLEIPSSSSVSLRAHSSSAFCGFFSESIKSWRPPGKLTWPLCVRIFEDLFVSKIWCAFLRSNKIIATEAFLNWNILFSSLKQMWKSVKNRNVVIKSTQEVKRVETLIMYSRSLDFLWFTSVKSKADEL